ncbi:hypothetical protein [Haloferax sp. DFSO52]|uniref:hypothetical protein n=1 Tax=Haloferax sp. DFSO52 TaxID=3388505 RepID=UPI003A8C78EA
MSDTASSVEIDRYPVGVRGPLQPFAGVVCPYIGFESGHTLWLLLFESTPTPVGSYAEIWVETPDGESTLYAPSGATDFVTSYHEFDRVKESAISWVHHEGDGYDVTMESADGTTIDLRIDFEVTRRTRVLNLLGALLPTAISRTTIGSSIRTFLFNLLLPVGGSKVRGKTETGVQYWVDTDRILDVSAVRATLNGVELGGLAPSRSRTTRGDISWWENPYALVGRVYLEYPIAGQPIIG